MKRLLDKSDTLDMALDRMFHVTDEHVSRLMHAQSQEILENKGTASEFVDKLEFLTLSAEELISDKSSLQSELMRKDEMIKACYLILSLIQESASIAKDQNNQLQEMTAALETLEDELASKSAELDEVVAQAQIHESELVEKDKRISALVLEIDETYEKLNLISSENLELKDFVKNVVDMKDTLEHEVKQRTEVTERLEREIIAMNALLSQKNLCLQDLQNDMNKVEAERDNLEHEVKQRTEVTERLEEEIITMNALLSQRNLCLQDLQNDMNTAEAKRDYLEHEVKQRNEVIERLEEEILATNTLLSQRNLCLQDLQYGMNKVDAERDHLESMVVMLKEQLEMAQALAEENEAIATEAHQIAEGRKAYAEDKEEEVKMLERSVEDLECTVNALENKVGLVKGEMERQWLQREELQMELEIVRNQMLIVPASGNIWNAAESGKTDISRIDKDKLIELQEAEQIIQFLQKEIGDKDAEIIQFKEHINELNMHAQAQAREYKQKFRELEGMARQVKLEPAPSSSTSLTSSKAEKSAAKTRGSGLPFKCMRLGITQQINSEKDEVLTVARHQIEEL